ncbi:FG-GAP-like repeat-containing protein [Paraliomyxa miuraensis]|uniref:FG-GAP-like repeat-containing protein n=1 Tax=Paraliomyxa miuraensis TaxID=376150 RepID=UPI0022546AD8|nr:FG-GAP-like repeat-containing protein [Paraliomyxa miuraensis]MCX4242459.1 FG-GAP-like repeat-containing protein [Paraliomyxa miuraensis]
MRHHPVVSSRLSLLGVGALGLLALPGAAHALDPFTNATPMLNNPNVSSGVAMGVADLDGDGLDDIIRMHDADDLEIEYQQPDGTFSHYVWMQGLPGSSQWGMAIGDADGNGYKDIFAGGAYNGMKLLRANDMGDDFTLSTLPAPGVFVQCVNFADIDNNGTLDLFVCHDDGLSAPLSNDGSGNFTYDTGLINPVSTVPSDNSGNYGTVWTDYDDDGDLDLYIAKCRLSVNDPMDGRRLNLLFENDGNGNYTDVAEARGLRPGAQSWVMDFGDIDNDGDMDGFLVNHDMLSQLYENPGGGAPFVDITAGSGMTADLQAIDLGIQAHFEDFDNDTFIDLLVTGREGQHRLFFNNGDHTFTADLDAFPTGGLGIQSAVVGDLDADGFRDVLAGFATGYNQPSFGNPDRLFLNPGNANHWLDIRLTGVESNVEAVGARVELHGPWGIMVREVRAGEGYGVVNSFTTHFGLGAHTAIDSVVVRWPSGHVDTSNDPAVLDEQVHIIEGCPDTWYPDTDGDGHGDASAGMTACLRPQGHVADDTDCDDADGDAFPDNPEVCDGKDNDCNGELDEGIMCDPDTGGVDGSGSGSSDGNPADGSSSGLPPGTSGPDGTTAVGSSGDDAGTTDGDGDAGAADGGGQGCGCATGNLGGEGGRDRGGPAGLMVLAFGLLLGRRRRRCARA